MVVMWDNVTNQSTIIDLYTYEGVTHFVLRDGTWEMKNRLYTI